ncbi:olfactory receptor 1G1-like [Rhinatrema bivittatum]|uniref:olfactory receptor 1G1-like n=1 Tax=Rhinatrema bivittatum TaxID=194408 RepID=UPI00112ABCF9|nr:olfactory receptor 1G1-like [Rhinatrema bivittatum]
MEPQNWTTVTEFLLLGFSDLPEHQISLFVLFFTMYLINLLGNTIMITLIATDHHLHTPMYFFISNLSFVDMCFSSVTVPQMLINIFSENKAISYTSCMAQLSFFINFNGIEVVLLAVMAYDRYVAICNPLHYPMLMNKKICLCLLGVCWLSGALNSLLHTILMCRLSFCSSNKIIHFFCDMPPLFKLSCTDTSLNELMIFTEGSLFDMVPFLFIIVSYIRIISTIFKTSSVSRRSKAFSTCSSHMITVTLYYGSIFFMYFRPSTSYSLEYDRVASVIYTTLTPMLNSFIYSLRNKDVKVALKRAISEKILQRVCSVA